MRYLALAVLLLPFLAAAPAQAEVGPENVMLPGVCGPRDELVEKLREKFEETAVVVGAVENAAIMEVCVNPTAKTWSVVLTLTSSGKACILAAGEGYEFAMPPEAVKKKGIAL